MNHKSQSRLLVDIMIGMSNLRILFSVYVLYQLLSTSLSDRSWIHPISPSISRVETESSLDFTHGIFLIKWMYLRRLCSKANQPTLNSVWMRRLIPRDMYIDWYGSIEKSSRYIFASQAQSRIIPCFSCEKNYSSIDFCIFIRVIDTIYENIFGLRYFILKLFNI